MKQGVITFILLFLFLCQTGSAQKQIINSIPQKDSSTTTNSPSNYIYQIKIDDKIINPITYEYVHKAIQQAEEAQAQCLIIELDTPGGLLNSTRVMVKDIMNAQVPIVVYISPRGARAGSAGVFITLASHIAAMAPSTNIGAAHPVNVGGQEDKGSWREFFRELKRYREKKPDHSQQDEGAPKKGKDKPQESPPQQSRSPMQDKIVNDTVAWVRAIAAARGRNQDWAEAAVRKSISVTAKEALEKKVIDLIASDMTELIKKLDGRTVSLPNRKVVLNTKEAEVVLIPMTARQRILHAIINPNIAYILMILGFYGLLFEITHPGAAFPGIAGAICLILAFYAFQSLPVNYAGLLLIALSLVLFIAEVKVQSFGLLALGGIISMLLGSLMLIDSPLVFMRVSLGVIIPIVLSTAIIVIFLVSAVIRIHMRRSVTGDEGMLEEIGIAATDIMPEGKVSVHGELWNAVLNNEEEVVHKGERIKIREVKGLKVVIEKLK
jgi:membrane-bound serine protease (ClpP class)